MYTQQSQLYMYLIDSYDKFLIETSHMVDKVSIFQKFLPPTLAMTS